MKAENLTTYVKSELHRLVAANEQTRAVVRAMHNHTKDKILEAALERFLAIAKEEKGVLEWLLFEQGDAATPSESRPVQVMAHDGWLAISEKDAQLRDLEIATVSTQLQSFHLATWLGMAAWMRVLNLHDEADVCDRLATELRALEREIETLRPTLAQLDDNPDDSTERYKPSARRHYGNFSSTSLRV